jgi:acid phosphatase class B
LNFISKNLKAIVVEGTARPEIEDKERFKFNPKDYPVTEDVFSRTITLPIFYGMADEDVTAVCDAVRESLKTCRTPGSSSITRIFSFTAERSSMAPIIRIKS